LNKIELYDTTLRDGAQMEGISLSVEDKIKITLKLDELGVSYIEGGWPGSNPKDEEYFERVKTLKLENSLIVAFGSTRRAGISAKDDVNIRALLEAETPVVTLVAKAWDMQVTRILETSLEENLAMISDSVSFLKLNGRRVFLDAEHFFDGFKADSEYALQCLKAASDAGAETLVLCDTNGGTLPAEIKEIINFVKQKTNVPLGIHAHNDCEVAVANSLVAVAAGVNQIQGCVNGYGERCGNANLLSVAANLKLKLGIPVITDEQLAKLTEVHLYMSEIVNMPSIGNQPFVGHSAFSHKGGLHGSAVAKMEDSYQHIKPEVVGNNMRVLVSELAGRGNVLKKIEELGIPISLSKNQATSLITEIKKKESQGFQYEGAEASFELMVRRNANDYIPPFEPIDYRIIVEQKHPNGGELQDAAISEATVKVKINGEIRHTADAGNGPVNAMDGAIRQALIANFPELRSVRLVDYKVRVVDQGSGTSAVVRVLVESTDGVHTWQTVGASPNIIEASWQAVIDSLEYWLLKYSPSLSNSNS
jgi:2-isopropylmalate synthase